MADVPARARRALVAMHLGAAGAYTTRGLQPNLSLGDPKRLVDRFGALRADGVIIIDVEAARRPFKRDLSQVARLAEGAECPLSYVGGIRDAREANEILATGIKRVGVGSLLTDDPDEVARLVDSLGSDATFAFVDHFETGAGARVWTARGGISRLGVLDAVSIASDVGLGEVIMRSGDRDGSLSGWDRATWRAVAGRVDIPLVVGGGVNGMDLEGLSAGPSADGPSVMGTTVFFAGHEHEPDYPLRR